MQVSNSRSSKMLISLLAPPLLSLSVVALTFPAKLLYQDPSGLFLENMAVRPSGDILITSVASPTLFSFNPTVRNATLDKVYTFPDCTSLTGVIEYKPDVYAVVASTINITTRRADPGSISVWTFKLQGRAPSAQRIAVIANSTLLDGISLVPGNPNLVLAGDPGAGTVWQINLVTGAHSIIVQDAAMAPGAPPPALGINGLHMQDERLFYSNGQLETFNSVLLAVDGDEVSRAGDSLTLNNVNPVGVDHQYDDFTFDSQGRIWVATHTGAVTLLTPQSDGTLLSQTVAGSETGPSLFNEPTSARFGRGTCAQEALLYVITATGQVIAVDTTASASETASCRS